MTDPQARVVIVGAGQAGVETALALRQRGHQGPVAIFGEEAALPYQRPPLSKAYLSRQADLNVLLLRAAPVYAQHNIELHTGRRVTALDRTARRVMLDEGGSQAYDHLVLATGGRARPLRCAGLSEDRKPANVHCLRTVADVEAIWRHFKPGAHLVLIGGGYIGLEVAAVARRAGLRVSLLEAQPRVLARVTAPQMSAFYESVHRAEGVDIRTGAQVESVELDASGQHVQAVRCTDGERIALDFMVVGIGLIPNTELAEAAGLVVDNGIVVDPYCQTHDPAILAVGDCARYPSARYGRSLRIESVPNALEHARRAAGTLCGDAQPHDPVPWFWSDQYDLKLQMVGLADGHDQVVLRGDPADRTFSTLYLRAGVLIAADTVNRPQEFMFAKRLVASQARPDAAGLADPATPLKSVL